jgi:MFS family permease
MSQNCPISSIDDPSTVTDDCIPMNDWEWGLFVSLFVIGGILGSPLGGKLATLHGRRMILFWGNLGFLFGTSLIYSGTSFGVLCLGRLLIGISAGMGTAVVPLYISELAPLAQRGTLGSLNQLFIVIGILIAGLLGVPLSTRLLWRNLFSIAWCRTLLVLAFSSF